MDTREGGGRRGWDEWRRMMETYTLPLPYVKQPAGGNLPYDSGNSNWGSVKPQSGRRWGWFKREGAYAYLWLTHVDVWQKPIQYCKAIFLPLKISFFSFYFKLGYEVLPHPPYSPDLSPTNYHFSNLHNFLQAKCFHNQQKEENAFQEFIES